MTERRMPPVAKKAERKVPAVKKMEKNYWVPGESQAATLSRLMHERGVKQPQIAEVLGCSQSNVSHVKNGKQSLTAEQIDRLARFFDVEHSIFFGGVKTPPEVNKEET